MISNCKLLTKKYREKFFKIYCQKSLDYSRKIVIFAIPNFKYFIFFFGYDNPGIYRQLPPYSIPQI